MGRIAAFFRSRCCRRCIYLMGGVSLFVIGVLGWLIFRPVVPLPFQHFEHVASGEQVATYSLGTFVVPVPVRSPAESGTSQRFQQVQIEFDLHVTVHPKYYDTFDKEYKRLEGRVREEVIRACRGLASEDLYDPTLNTLKAQLLDLLLDYFRASHMEQLVIVDTQLRAL